MQQRKGPRILVDDLSLVTGRSAAQPLFAGAEAVLG